MNWYKKASRTIEEHIRDTVKAPIDIPIFVRDTYEIIDGAHRTAKAYILNKTIKGIILSQDDLNKALLTTNSPYVGQIYRDDDKNEYAVTTLIELYGKRKPIILNPRIVLENSPDVWGKKIDIYEIMEEAEKVINAQNNK